MGRNSQHLSWVRSVVTILVCCYGLGLASSMCGVILEVLASPVIKLAVDFRTVAVAGIANAFSPAMMLVAWSALYWAVEHWQEARLRERQLLLAQSLARDAELMALRYQITPHFLFNTLNGISTLVGEGDVLSARRMISLLAGFLRSTLEPAAKGDVPIATELAQVRQYLEIEQIRLGRRLVARIHCDKAARDALVPHLLLQPLVENAVRHGIAPSIRGGELTLNVRRCGNGVSISVHNSLDHPAPVPRKAAGLGLANTRARLAARYRDDYRFLVSGDAARGWCADIHIPHEVAGRRLA